MRLIGDGEDPFAAAAPAPEDRRAAALTLAVEAYRDDPGYRAASSVDVRTDRILHAARKFEAFLKGHTDDDA